MALLYPGTTITKQACTATGDAVKIPINVSGTWDEQTMSGVNMLEVPSDYLPVKDGKVGTIKFSSNGAVYTGNIMYAGGEFTATNPQQSARPTPRIESISINYTGDISKYAPEGHKLVTLASVIKLING